MLKLRVSILIPQTYGKAIFSRGKTDILSKELTKIVVIAYTDLNGNFRNRSGLVRQKSFCFFYSFVSYILCNPHSEGLFGYLI